MTKEEGHAKTDKNLGRIAELQEMLYAEHKQSLLIVLQAMDAGGKDGTVKVIGSGMNPAGCKVISFKVPTSEELNHDFLWRIEKETPRKGDVTIFNRSHYEDVLVVRVNNLVPKPVWKDRFDQINDFERRLVANGTRIVKFFLHISKEEQLARLRERIEDPSKNWKVSASDFTEREKWPLYQEAYEDVLSKTSFKHAPWFIIPADHKWSRDYVISSIILETLEDMKLTMPVPTVNIEELRAKYFSGSIAREDSRGKSHKIPRHREESTFIYAPVAATHLQSAPAVGSSLLGFPK